MAIKIQTAGGDMPHPVVKITKPDGTIELHTENGVITDQAKVKEILAKLKQAKEARRARLQKQKEAKNG